MAALEWNPPFRAGLELGRVWSRPAEDELLARAGAGEGPAVEELVRRYQDTVYSMALSFTRDPHRAEDLAQEAWIRALRGLPGFRGQARFSTWLYRVIMNTFLNSREKPPGQEVEVADQGLDRVESALAVQQAVRALPEEFRAVVVLRYTADLSYKEIAEVLGVPLGTVQSRLKRALERLARALDEKGGGP